MMDDRNYILQRLMSKKTTIEEFNYDTLQAPPLSWFLSPYDIGQLNQIATSLKLSAKPEIRYSEIDSILRSRGLIKFGAGTNRVVYRHPEFQDILFKVAADDVGMGDNPAEFRNQLLLKPFCTKMFEVSRYGEIAIVERVNPIKSREEFLSISDDIFSLLTDYIIGEYIVADCGSRFFMNYGVRSTFGVVLLDYPYVYELDGNKLYCRKPDPLSQTGKCDGIIDYDDGYNFLRCTKCGATYKAKELRKAIDENEISLIKDRKDEIIMNITVKGGSKNIQETKVTTGEHINSEVFKKTEKKIPVQKKEFAKKTVNGVQSTPEKKTEAPKQEVVEPVTDVKSEEVVNNEPAAEPAREARSPITISEEIKQKAIENKESDSDNKNPNDIIDHAIKDIADNINRINIDAVKYDFIKRILLTLTEDNNTNQMFELLSSCMNTVLEEASDDEYENICSDTNLANLIHSMYEYKLDILDINTDEDGDINVKYNIDVLLMSEGQFGSDLSDDERTVAYTIEDKDNNILILDRHDIAGLISEPDEETESPVEVINEDDADDENIEPEKNKVSLYDAKIININNILPNQTSKKGQNIIVICDSKGDFLSNEYGLIAADIINDINVDDIELVSKEWVKSVNEVLGDEEKEAPVGAVPPVSEDGTTQEDLKEFLDTEEAADEVNEEE